MSTTDKYGLTKEDRANLLAFQDNRCAICRRRFTRRRVPHTDHDHRTFRTRGLLCLNCNRLLGLLHDDAEWLENAANFLHNPPASQIGLAAYHADSPYGGERA